MSAVRVGSRLELMAIAVPNHFFMSSGDAVTGLSFAFMMDTSFWFQHDDEAAGLGVTCEANCFPDISPNVGIVAKVIDWLAQSVVVLRCLAGLWHGAAREEAVRAFVAYLRG
jgi:hypothetical protein